MRPKNPHKNIQIGFYLSEEEIKRVDKLVSEGYYINRSDLLRDALRLLFREEGVFAKNKRRGE